MVAAVHQGDGAHISAGARKAQQLGPGQGGRRGAKFEARHRYGGCKVLPITAQRRFRFIHAGYEAAQGVGTGHSGVRCCISGAGVGLCCQACQLFQGVCVGL